MQLIVNGRNRRVSLDEAISDKKKLDKVIITYHHIKRMLKTPGKDSFPCHSKKSLKNILAKRVNISKLEVFTRHEK